MYGFGSYCFFDTGTAEIRGIKTSSDTPHTFASCKTVTATRWDLHNVVLMSQCVRRARGVPAARRSAWRSTPCARAEFSTDIHMKLHQEWAWSVIDQSPRVLLLWGQEFEHPEVSYCHFCACFQNKSHQAPPNDHVFLRTFIASPYLIIGGVTCPCYSPVPISFPPDYVLCLIAFCCEEIK